MDIPWWSYPAVITLLERQVLILKFKSALNIKFKINDTPSLKFRPQVDVISSFENPFSYICQIYMVGLKSITYQR